MRNHKVFTLWLFMIRERPREAKVPHTSRKKTNCQSRNITIRILVSFARKWAYEEGLLKVSKMT
jgi:hypothetical protein